jgi:hypothetical protein
VDGRGRPRRVKHGHDEVGGWVIGYNGWYKPVIPAQAGMTLKLPRGTSRAIWYRAPMVQFNRSFLLLFFKKEVLAFA